MVGQIVYDIVIGMSDGFIVFFVLVVGLLGVFVFFLIVVIVGLVEVVVGLIVMGFGGWVYVFFMFFFIKEQKGI